MEKKYPLYGLDVDDTTSPLEANLAWAVDVDKHGYIGREALRRQLDAGVSRLLVGIEFPALSFVPAAGVHPAGTGAGSLAEPLAAARLPGLLHRKPASTGLPRRQDRGRDADVPRCRLHQVRRNLAQPGPDDDRDPVAA